MIKASVTIADLYLENDIIIVKYKNGCDFDGDLINEMFRKFEEMGNGKKYKVIYDALDLEIGHISRSAYTESISNAIAVNRIAEAYAINNLPVRLIINFYHKVIKPKFPSKVFKTVEEAKSWLNTF